MTAASDTISCAGCGASPSLSEPYPFRCPNANGDDVDHVLRRTLAPDAFFPADDDPNPFIRYRTLLHSYRFGRANGFGDEHFRALVRRLDDAIAAVDGHRFRVTPFGCNDSLSQRLGFSRGGGVWVKDETGNVAGSHKARHLFEVLLQIEVAEAVGLADPAARPQLAIASCGNAALAAAVLAAASRRRLRVFVPVDADGVVLSRLATLGADVVVCARKPGESGDPTYTALRDSLASGALPFTCQGNLNGLAVEGGHTLGWELVSQLADAGTEIDRVVVQVGGGALASAVAASLREAVDLGMLARAPRLDTVQTAGAWPLRRAFDLVGSRGDGALAYAAGHRSEFMWPWQSEPHSIAGGILDDETYDWLAVVEAMLATGGRPVVVPETVLARAYAFAHENTAIDVDPTGSSGLAGLLGLLMTREVDPGERVAVLFTGVRRTNPSKAKETHDEKLPRARHPVAQGLRAR